MIKALLVEHKITSEQNVRYIFKKDTLGRIGSKRKLRVIACLAGQKSSEFARRIAVDDRWRLAGWSL